MRAYLIALSLASIACGETPHVVEELTFRVAPADQAEFLRIDREVWTEALSRQVGFLGKEAWVTSPKTDELKLVIRWRARSDWNAVPKELLAATDARFTDAMGGRPYELLGGRAFRVVTPESEAGVGLPIDALLTAENLLRAEVVTVENDPVYHADKKYLAISVWNLILQFAKETKTYSDTIVFECDDNYNSQIELGMILPPLTRGIEYQLKPYLAFRDLDAPEGQQWTAEGTGPTPEKMGSAYLVWPLAKDRAGLTWPYGIERIRLVNSSDVPQHSKTAPPPD